MSKIIPKQFTNLDNFTYADFHSAIAGRVKGQPELSKITTAVWVYLQSMMDFNPVCYHALLSAPSGCGKTETYRAIHDWMEENLPAIPVVQVDMTSITEEGFKGKDTESIVTPLLDENAICGIVFLDEVDKKILPAYDNKGTNINRAVQSQLLTAIEGRKIEDKKNRTIDTHNVLFIACGAFDFVRENKVEQKKEEVSHRSLGFGEDYHKKADTNTTHYAPITREDIIDAGGMFEFIGRFSFVVNYQPLSKTILNQIIDSQIDRLSTELNIKAVIRPKMRAHLHSLANGRYGCRALWSCIIDTALSVYPEAITQYNKADNIQICITLTGPGKARWSVESLPEIIEEEPEIEDWNDDFPDLDPIGDFEDFLSGTVA